MCLCRWVNINDGTDLEVRVKVDISLVRILYNEYFIIIILFEKNKKYKKKQKITKKLFESVYESVYESVWKWTMGVFYYTYVCNNLFVPYPLHNGTHSGDTN